MTMAQLTGFAVTPKSDCPHVADILIASFPAFPSDLNSLLQQSLVSSSPSSKSTQPQPEQEAHQQDDPTASSYKRPEWPCVTCQNTKENWICLTCGVLGCSRYIESHMVLHHEDTLHPIVVSLSDLSVHCYLCGEYIKDERLRQPLQVVYKAKFGLDPPDRADPPAVIEQPSAASSPSTPVSGVARQLGRTR